MLPGFDPKSFPYDRTDLTGRELDEATYNLSSMIGLITFIDEELSQNHLNEAELYELQSKGKYKNLLFDFFFKSHKEFILKLVVSNETLNSKK